jgi:polysaccharide export outer membrane protein
VLAAAAWPVAPAAQQARPTSAPAAPVDPNFVIGPNDRVRITVWNQNNISGDYTIQRDGTFTFPLIGRVAASGLTVSGLEKEMRQRLMDGYFKDPQVTVAVVENQSQRVFVVGELRAPGTFPITGDVTLVEMLAKAGSTTADAADHAFIIRPAHATGPVLPGEDTTAAVTRVDLRRLDGGVALASVLVHDGDTVFVPRAATIFIYGEVKRPGSYPITQDMTVRQALSLAGGLSDYGASNRLKILRVVNGSEREIKVKLNDKVRAGDTLVVPVRRF